MGGLILPTGWIQADEFVAFRAQLWIDESGRVQRVEWLARSGGTPEQQRTLAAAIQSLPFSPARLAGQAVPSTREMALDWGD